jgi:hypothetical protein
MGLGDRCASLRPLRSEPVQPHGLDAGGGGAAGRGRIPCRGVAESGGMRIGMRSLRLVSGRGLAAMGKPRGTSTDPQVWICSASVPMPPAGSAQWPNCPGCSAGPWARGRRAAASPNGRLAPRRP